MKQLVKGSRFESRHALKHYLTAIVPGAAFSLHQLKINKMTQNSTVLCLPFLPVPLLLSWKTEVLYLSCFAQVSVSDTYILCRALTHISPPLLGTLWFTAS